MHFCLKQTFQIEGSGDGLLPTLSTVLNVYEFVSATPAKGGIADLQVDPGMPPLPLVPVLGVGQASGRRARAFRRAAVVGQGESSRVHFWPGHRRVAAPGRIWGKRYLLKTSPFVLSWQNGAVRMHATNTNVGGPTSAW